MLFELHHGNCINVLPEFLGRGFDAVITDPPLNFGHEDFPGSAANWRDKYEDGTAQRQLAGLIRECVKPGAVAVVFFDTRALPAVSRAWKEAGWHYRRALTVRRAQSPRCWEGWWVASDIALVFSAPGLPSYSHSAGGDVLEPGPESAHPVGKPIGALREIVRNICPPGGTVLDPFMGSGPVGEACRLEGRGFVGVESDAHWFNVAKAKAA